MTRGRARRGLRERGAAAVELALVLPMLLLLIAGIIDFGRAFMTQIAISQGAREGARMLALGLPLSDAKVRVEQGANGALAASGASTFVYPGVTLCPSTPTPTDAASITVGVQFRYLILDGISNLFGGAIPSTATFTQTGSMRCLG